MDKVNYFKESTKEYRELRKENGNKKPDLLIHICCGACSCYPLIFLHDLFNVTILFSNSNIYPKSEYDLRLANLKKYVDIINKEFNENIKIIEDTYDYDEFKKDLLPYKDEKENGNRCHICITKRLKSLFEYASKHDYHLVTTVMSISRNKDVDFLNKTGLALSKNYKGVTYFVSDFKKNNGQDYGVLLSKKFDIYRQDYCGCEFSKMEE
jgi:predicted adenine nucleotide alpha hydrolase (AANH) superfamily ATPase